jgi:hypothetical protein
MGKQLDGYEWIVLISAQGTPSRFSKADSNVPKS